MKKYIDADKAVNALIEYYGLNAWIPSNVIRSVPAADVIEQKHGKWIPMNEDGSWRVDTCSACGKDTHYMRYAPAYDYCPNCGCKMKG